MITPITGYEVAFRGENKVLEDSFSSLGRWGGGLKFSYQYYLLSNRRQSREVELSRGDLNTDCEWRKELEVFNSRTEREREMKS